MLFLIKNSHHQRHLVAYCQAATQIFPAGILACEPNKQTPPTFELSKNKSSRTNTVEQAEAGRHKTGEVDG
jgi:hypothetical protein